MKQSIITLSLLLLTLLPASAVKKIQANPINIAIQLVEKTDSAKVVSTLHYYGYESHGSDEGYQIMKDSEGNEIRFSFINNISHSHFPTVIVKTKEPHKSIDSRLTELNFEKKGNGYERMRHKFSKYRTQCGFGPNNTLIIRRVQN